MKNSLESAELASSTNGLAITIYSIADFRTEYLKADVFCQEVQGFLNLAGVPAVNELRNAGKHLLSSLGDDGQIISQVELGAGIGHSRKACYEAYEAGILVALEIIQKFREDYSTTTIGSTVSNYPNILQRAHNAQKSVEQGRHPEFDRTIDHTRRMEAFRELRECAELLMVGREEMNKKVASERRKARLVMLGIVVAILVAVWAATGYWHPWQE